MKSFSREKNIYYILRISIALCFIGHGAFGVITKEIWCNYFAVFGIGRAQAYQFMPVIGVFDIILGLIMIVYPIRAIPGWLVIWGLFTALLRPLSGEPFAEFIERAGNFGVPFAMLLLTGSGKSFRNWFSKIDPDIKCSEEALKNINTCLKITVFLLFLGHGWLNIIHKASLLNQYSSLGFTNPVNTAGLIGIFEVIAAFAVLIRPVRSVLVIMFFWKILSELFYPNYEFLEFVERSGSYGAVLALWMVLNRHAAYRFTAVINHELASEGN